MSQFRKLASLSATVYAHVCWLVLLLAAGASEVAAAPESWTPTPNDRIQVISTKGGFVTAQYEASDLALHAVPDDQISLWVRVEVLHGDPPLQLTGYHQGVVGTGPSSIDIRPPDNVKWPLQPVSSRKETNAQHLEVDVTVYECPLRIDRDAEPRKYPLVLRFERRVGGKLDSVTADYMLPVGLNPDPTAKDPHPIRIQTAKTVTVTTGMQRLVPILIRNGFSNYDVSIKGIDIFDDDGLIKPIHYSPNKSNSLPATEPSLPCAISYNRWKEIKVPIHAASFPWASLLPGSTKTPTMNVSVFYSDGYRDEVQTIPVSLITFRHVYFWPLAIVGIVLGSLVGVLLRRKYLAPASDSLWQHVFYVVMATSVMVAVSELLKLQVIAVDGRQILSYSNPFSAFIACALVGLSNVQELLRKLLKQAGAPSNQGAE